MKGVYALLIKFNRDSVIKIGSLGEHLFKKGLYSYIGSAQNNLEKRVNRHLSNNKKLHWHIDYLLSDKSTKIIKIFYNNKNKIDECRIAKALLNNQSIKGFGCSDCNCFSHLVRINNEESLLKLGLVEL
jgi:Uri superfamily endonuclease